MNKLFLIVALCFAPFFGFSQAHWQATSGEVMFKIKNAGVTVTGRFSGLKTALVFSADKPGSSSLKGSVDVATIKTGIDKRDQDLLGDKYFDAAKYKQIEISSVSLEKKGSAYSGKFNVTIKGVTKQVEIPFTFTESGGQGAFKGDFTINRRDFGVGGKSMMMADELTVNIDVKAKK